MKAWRNIEKRYKMIFYLTVILAYFIFLDNFYDLGSKAIPVKHGFAMKYVTPGIGEYLRTFTGYFSWFLIALLGYFSRNRFDGMMIGLTFLAPWLLWTLFSEHWSLKDFEPGMAVMSAVFTMFLTILASLIGIVFGFIGSKRGKDTSGEG